MMPMLTLPVWITLNFLPLEFIDEIDYIAWKTFRSRLCSPSTQYSTLLRRITGRRT
jgi:hypothetical protein